MIGSTVQPFYLLSQFKVVFYHRVFVRVSNKIFWEGKSNAKCKNMVLHHSYLKNNVTFGYNSIFEIFSTKTDLKSLKITFLFATRRALSNHLKKTAKKNFAQISTCRHLTSPTLIVEELDQLVENYISAIETNTLDDLGYHIKTSAQVYGVSKAVLNALTQIEAREWSAAKNLLVISVSPGFCATDMTQHSSDARSPELGADSILHAVNTPHNELENGGFYRDGKQLPLISEPIPKA